MGASPIFACIRKSKVVLSIKVFAWLLVGDRLNTKNMLRRRHWNVTDNTHCELCPARRVEDWQYLFYHYNFNVRIWNYLQTKWEPGDSFEQVFFKDSKSFLQHFISEVVILAAWQIWKQRNDVIFKKVQPSFRSWKRCFVQDGTMHWHRFGSKVAQQWSIWIDNFP